MTKKKKDKQNPNAIWVPSPLTAPQQRADRVPKMKRKPYEKEMRVLHGELIAMQEWVKESGAKACVVFEGRDTDRWYDYSRARDAMLVATDTAWAPWYIAHTDDKRRGRLNIISHLLSQVPYKPLSRVTSRCPSDSGLAATGNRTRRCGTSRHRSKRRAERNVPCLHTG